MTSRVGWARTGSNQTKCILQLKAFLLACFICCAASLLHFLLFLYLKLKKIYSSAVTGDHGRCTALLDSKVVSAFVGFQIFLKIFVKLFNLHVEHFFGGSKICFSVYLEYW